MDLLTHSIQFSSQAGPGGQPLTLVFKDLKELEVTTASLLDPIAKIIFMECSDRSMLFRASNALTSGTLHGLEDPELATHIWKVVRIDFHAGGEYEVTFNGVAA